MHASGFEVPGFDTAMSLASEWMKSLRTSHNRPDIAAAATATPRCSRAAGLRAQKGSQGRGRWRRGRGHRRLLGWGLHVARILHSADRGVYAVADGRHRDVEGSLGVGGIVRVALVQGRGKGDARGLGNGGHASRWAPVGTTRHMSRYAN